MHGAVAAPAGVSTATVSNVILRQCGAMTAALVERMAPEDLWELFQRVVPPAPECRLAVHGARQAFRPLKSGPFPPTGLPSNSPHLEPERLVHHHGYLWTGAKERFDQEALRRPPHPEPPPAGSKPELIQRYREVAVEFPTVDLPPLETAYWLIKPGSLVRGTWEEAKDAAAWLAERLAEYAPRFAADRDRDTARLAMHVNAAAERLASGADVSLGFYLERPSYLSLAVVTCCPNASKPELDCPEGRSTE